MKKILVLILSLFLLSCNNIENKSTQKVNENIVNNTLENSIEKKEENATNTYQKDGKCNTTNLNFSDNFISNLDEYIWSTKTINFINNMKNIGFIYEMGLNWNDEDIKYFEKNIHPKDEYGNLYIYYGDLTELSDNIYASKGIMPPSMQKDLKSISDKVDFYIKFEGNRVYFIFEDLTNKKLVNYIGNIYMECLD